MRVRLAAVADVLRWAEPHAWEDDDDELLVDAGASVGGLRAATAGSAVTELGG